MNDSQLVALILDRQRMLRHYASVLRRVGASHPKRATVNASRARLRQKLRLSLRENADAIAARVMEISNA